MSKTKDDAPGVTVSAHIPTDLRDRLDAWRGGLVGKPSRSKALAVLLEAGLDAVKAGKGKR